MSTTHTQHQPATLVSDEMGGRVKIGDFRVTDWFGKGDPLPAEIVRRWNAFEPGGAVEQMAKALEIALTQIAGFEAEKSGLVDAFIPSRQGIEFARAALASYESTTPAVPQ